VKAYFVVIRLSASTLTV